MSSGSFSSPPGLFPPAEVGGWLAWSPEGAGLDTGGGAFGPGGPVVFIHCKPFSEISTGTWWSP